MSLLRKKKSILSILRDRELNNKCAPHFLSVSIISRLIRSDKDDLYNNNWEISSNRPIVYDYGHLYFSNYTRFCSIFGKINEPSPMLELEVGAAQKKVSDAISYSIPVYKNVDGICKCRLQQCTCSSQYIISVSEDNWLNQRLMTNGRSIKEIYVNRIGHRFSFKYCDWDVYGDRFILTSTLDPVKARGEGRRRPDVVVNLAVFTVFPVEFLALLEIKRSVFGSNCTAANVSDQQLIVGIGAFRVHIFSFEDFLKEGNLTPYKLGDNFESEGKIGTYPTGLPINFTYDKTPPLLFDVQCFGQALCFGGYPYHYVISSVRNQNIFSVKDVETGKEALGSPLTTGSFSRSCFSDDLTSLLFCADHSNRLIFQRSQAVDCYKLSYENNISKVTKLFSMGFSSTESDTLTTQVSMYGRKISRKNYSDLECAIFSIDYSDDLQLFAILGVQQNAPTVGYVRLYDSVTGEEVRTFRLKHRVYDHKFYHLYMDMATIVILERRSCPDVYTVHVYNL